MINDFINLKLDNLILFRIYPKFNIEKVISDKSYDSVGK